MEPDKLLAGDTLHSNEPEMQFMIDSAVPASDDPDMPSLTFRVVVLGTVFTCALAFTNAYYWFRSNPIALGIPVVQLLSLPAGWALAQVLPRRQFQTFGKQWTMNPGAFSIKEHVLISVFANASTSTVYALELIVVRKFWIGTPLAFGAGVLMSLTSQLIGYSFSGMFHRILVEPSAMVWPSTLVDVSLFRTLQAMMTDKHGLAREMRQRQRLFWIALAASFAWYFVPGWFFPTLTMLPLLCFAAPNNVVAQQLGDGYNGLGMLALTLDWSTISSSYTGSPLATPWFAACNLFAGFAIFMWVITPIAYYANAWDARSLPIYTSNLFAANGSVYDIEAVLRDGRLDPELYEEYGPVRMSTQFLIMYGLCFMGITCLLSHVALNHGKDLWRTLRAAIAELRSGRSYRRSGADRESIAYEHSGYARVPGLWYVGLFVATLAMGLGACQGFGLLPWWGFLLAIALAALLTVPVGLIEAVSNFQYGLGVITELIAAFIWPGEPTFNAAFKMFGYITMRQTLQLTRDQKLGRYMRVPPRHVFAAQVAGTVAAALVQLGVAAWLMHSVPDICTDAGAPFTCRKARLFYATTTIWGVLGPQRQFAGRYAALYWLFLAGAALPVPVWLLRRRFPRSMWRLVSLPVVLTLPGYFPNMPTHNAAMFTLCCFVFNHILLHRRPAWWQRYNFVLTAALDAGLAVSGIIGYFALQHVRVNWWGTQDHCPLSSRALDQRVVPGT
ncbi:hypothetical protein IW147_002020 [Coemansia sp. RSA 720]|nr:hypothetical protein IW147_002020 [Coemansia sp. RSA 720]